MPKASFNMFLRRVLRAAPEAAERLPVFYLFPMLVHGALARLGRPCAFPAVWPQVLLGVVMVVASLIIGNLLQDGGRKVGSARHG